MISIDRFEEILSDLAEEIPQSFYEELNGGIVVEPGYLLHPEDRSGTLYVMLIADPAGFQKSTGALAYLDGTPPEDDADDWQNMVYRWTDCPVLAGMDLGDYDGYTLLDDATGSNQSVLSPLYVGRRAVLDEAQAAHYADGEELWQRLTAGAVSPAAAE